MSNDYPPQGGDQPQQQNGQQQYGQQNGQQPYGQQNGQQPYGQQNGQQPYGQQPAGQQGQFGYSPYGSPQPQYGGSQSAAPVGPNGQPPVWAPWYGISFPKAFTRFWKKYVAFSGRASRSEYWWWILWYTIVVVVIGIVIGVISGITGDYSTSTSSTSSGMSASAESNSPSNVLTLLWWLATVVGMVALQIRRLHDANLRGWFVLLNLIPILGGLVVLVLTILPSNPEGQRFDQPTS